MYKTRLISRRVHCEHSLHRVMLTLAAYADGNADCQYQPPKYILLRGASNIFGRGYQANIRMPFSWLSRKHAVITRVDSSCIIEACGQYEVFVNRIRTEFTTLSEGDQITFGGGTKNALIGSLLSSFCEPHISYVYHRSVAHTDESGSWYSDLSRPEDIIKVDDFVNGHIVTQSYHVEDFNITDESATDDSVANLTIVNINSSSTRQLLNGNDQVPRTNMLSTNSVRLSSIRESKANYGLESDSECVERTKPKRGRKKRSRGKQPTTSPKKNFGVVDNEPVMGTKRQLRQRKTLFDAGDNQDSSHKKCKPKPLDMLKKSSFKSVISDLDCKEGETSRVRGFRKKRCRLYLQTDHEDSDGDEYNSSSFDESPATKRLKLESAFLPVPGGKGKRLIGRQNRKKGKCKEEFDEGECCLLNSWYTKPVTRPTPRMVEILNGPHQRQIYAFNDKEVFQVIYKNGEDQRYQNLWNIVYDVIVFLDAALFEYKVKLGELDAEDLVRVSDLLKNTSSTISINDYDQPVSAMKISGIIQPEGITVQLKQYQLNTLGWMYDLELEVNKTWTVSRLVDWPEAEVDVSFDLINKRVFSHPVPSVSSTVHRINIKGGILADEMGLGKTVTVLSLIVTHQDTKSATIPSPTVFQSGQELLLPTKATLVIAPSHLTSQWKEEAEKHAPGLTVILISTKPQFEKYRYVDILKADLVIVSVQFLLVNKTYTALPSGVDADANFMHLLRKPGTNLLLKKCPNFAHFNWWRLICDEAHELIMYKVKQKRVEESPSNGLQMLEKMTARHKWYVTGTPLPHKERSLRGALKFLEMKLDDQMLMYQDGSLRIDQENLCFGSVHKFILETIYVRNTKESIGIEYNVPQYIEELMLLTMSDIERGIYDSASSEQEKRQLCCHLQIAARVKQIAGIQQKSLDEMKDAMIAHTESEINRLNKNITEDQDKVKLTKQSMVEEDKSHLRDLLENRIKRYEENIVSMEDLIKKHSSSLSYFENIAPRITQSADEPCVICLDNIVTLTVTSCGHLYCKKCILPYIRQREMCPTCRKHVIESDLVEVKNEDHRENLNRSAELQKLTEQFGTKMAHLIFYLRYLFKADPNSRVIIFSQWDELLHKISSTLHEHDIKNVFVKGNVHVRNKAILSFRKQEKTHVIMLSLQNAASGTNLVEASHVILIDPVAGSKEEARAIEAQAIGRAHRMGQDKQIIVVRMIVRDTIEHELCLRNISENIQEMELEIDGEDAETMGVQMTCKMKKILKPKAILAKTPSVFTNDVNSGSDVSRARNLNHVATSRTVPERTEPDQHCSLARVNAYRKNVLLSMQQFWS